MAIMMKTKKILVVSSDSRFMERFAQRRTQDGIAVEHARTGEESIVLVRILLPEIVLVGDDIQDIGPVALARRLRASVPSDSIPIVIVGLNQAALERSILSNESSVAPLPGPTRSGYLSEPIPPRRVTASQVDGTKNGNGSNKASDTNGSDEPSSLVCHSLRLDRNRHQVWVHETLVRLTPTEFRLLWELASRPGFVLSRQDLSQRCRRRDRAIQARTVDAHVKSIRRKLGSSSGLVETVHGIGYRFLDTKSISDQAVK